jgi:exopolysaccharide production protein ExoZ
LLEFLAGIGVAVLFLRVQIPAPAGWLALASGVGLLIAGTFIDAERQWTFGIPCALILIGCLTVGFKCESGLGRTLALAGDASYSIYLFHPLALPVIAIAFRMIGLGKLPTNLLIALLCLFACAAGTLCWIFIERPITNWSRSLSRAGRTVQNTPATAAK